MPRSSAHSTACLYVLASGNTLSGFVATARRTESVTGSISATHRPSCPLR